MKQSENKAAGCLLGGAVGDALGYPVEFMDADTIFRLYGERGIARYRLTNGKALVSDDTQMSIFTADGLLRAGERFPAPTAAQYVASVYESYLNWLTTQEEDYALPDNIPRSELL